MTPRLPTFLRRRAFPLAAPTWPDSVPRPAIERRTGSAYDTSWARRYPARLGRALVLDSVGRGVAQAIASPTIEGEDRLTGVRGPVVFAANHASHLDTPLILTCLPDRFRHKAAVAAGADYFFDKRWKGAIWSFLINAIPVERTKVSPSSARLAQRLLENGWSLVIFPEGGRSPDGWGQEHRAGAAFLSIKSGSPVVPVHLEGTRRILPKGRSLPRRSSTTVTFGAPLNPLPGEDPREFAPRIAAAIAALADEQATDWWTARRRAASGETPSLTGPPVSAWRRSWELGEHARKADDAGRKWPHF